MDYSFFDEVSSSAVWFLVGVICSTLILVVFFLFITKRLCFRQCDGCDALLRPGHQKLDNSAICCCRGFLSFFGGRSLVASAKLELANGNATKASDYNSTNNNNGSVVNSEPARSDKPDVSRSSSRIQRRPSFRQSMRSTPRIQKRRSRRANAYDDSDSASSLDSAEETARVIRKSLRKSRSSRNTISSTALSVENEHVNGEQQSQTSSRSSPNGHSEQYEYTRPSSSPTHEVALGESGAAEFVYDDVSSLSSQTSRGRTGREFARRPVRHKTPTPSMGSRLSLESVPENDKWNVGETGSIYARQLHDSSTQDSDDDDDYRSGKRDLGFKEGSMAGTTSDDDGEYHGGAVEPISACGTLDVAVHYSMSEQKLQITIMEAHDLPSKSRGGFSIVQVKAVLLPEKRKKYKTKVQHISSPRFAETFKLSRATPEDLKGLALRLRLYGIGKIKDSLIGEAIIRFDELNLIRDPQLTIQLQLEPRTDINRGESNTSLNQVGSRSSSMMSLSHGGSPPEILIGLSYSAPTGRLCVQVIKGSHFRNLAMPKPPDTFVKLSLLNSACQEMSQSKTTIRRGQPNPVYKEHFYFQVALFQLSEVTLMVSVFSKRTIKRKDMIGWVSMGRNSSSDIDEQHWNEMKDGKGQEICRWHALIDT